METRSDGRHAGAEGTPFNDGISDGSGTVTGTYEYDAFGAVRAQTGATTEWSFTGEQHDATGLEYLRARYYDASTGRFLSQDPMPLLQRYAYANDNPANLVDPSGLSPESDRFHELMAAEEQAQAWAKKILSDPCWLIHPFCKHVVGAWKKAAPYIERCGSGALFGAAAGAIGGSVAGPEGTLGGAASGAAWGCVAAVASYTANRQLSEILPANAGAQCAIGALSGAAALITTGTSAASAETGITALGGCALGGGSAVISYLERGATKDGLATSQCGWAGLISTATAFRLGVPTEPGLGIGAAACVGAAANEVIR